MSASRGVSLATGEDYPSPMASTIDPPAHKKGLARKLVCAVLSAVLIGVCLLLAMQVFLTLTAVPDWGGDIQDVMIELEQANLDRLAKDKAGFVTEIFGRVDEAMLHVQAFAEQVLLDDPKTMVVDAHLAGFSGLNQSSESWEHSAWYITDNDGTSPPPGSSLEGLLNRSTLMDVQFRSMERQHLLVFLAALDNPSPDEGVVSQINFQGYAAFDMEAGGYADFMTQEEVDCDPRFSEIESGYDPTGYEPRCRPWYQSAIDSSINSDGGVVFTNPYIDATSGTLIVSVGAPVYNVTDPTLLLGVVGIDVNVADIKESIENWAVVGDEGYAYILAPGVEGEVMVHQDLREEDGTKLIGDLDVLDEAEFGKILIKMSENCTGSEIYMNDGAPWLLSWDHETASGGVSTDGEIDCLNGFIIVTTVSESALLKVFSKTEAEIGGVVVVASLVMAGLLLVIGCCTACFAHALSKSITEPVNQLVDIVMALNSMDFSQQPAGTWIVNDVTSPEVEELMTAFKAMTTVVKFANITLGSGNINVAEQNYLDAFVLFKKLGNDRGVGIVNNNLGSVYTLQARELAARAATEPNRLKAGDLMTEADGKFSDAVTCFSLAIDDAEMLCSGVSQLGDAYNNATSSPLPHTSGGRSTNGGDYKDGESWPPARSPARVEDADLESRGAGAGAVAASSHSNNYDHSDTQSSPAALALQVANRKFNLALCYAAKANSAVPAGGGQDRKAAIKARSLMKECAKMAADRRDARGDQRQVECLLEMAALEGGQPDRRREAKRALDDAENVITAYRGAGRGGVDSIGGVGGRTSSGSGGGLSAAPALADAALPPPLAVLRQQLLAARGIHCATFGDKQAAIEHWTDAILGCGDRMNLKAIRSSLDGLLREAENGEGHRFPRALLTSLKVPAEERGHGQKPGDLATAIRRALGKLDSEAKKHKNAAGSSAAASSTTNVDLCFLMDCTRSMQKWIDQAKDKLVDIIAQAKKDVANINLRVSFVGYRDIGDTVRYEGPYNFHTEAELPKLLANLKDIKAVGGLDVPEDIAGGLKHAIELNWSSPIRLCILIADAPCHGTMYHSCRDNYPKGCPNGLDPSKLLYTLQYELGVDFYFVRITSLTDRMISVLENTVAAFHKQSRRPALRGTTNTEPKFVVHDLGSEDSRFLDAVVQSVKVSAGINLRVEAY